MQIIPYDPRTDPQQYLAQALQQGVSGFLGHRQRQQFNQGLSPTLEPMQLLQHALQSGLPIRDAVTMAVGMSRLGGQQQGFTLSPGQTRFGPQGKPIAKGVPKTEKPKRYDIRTLNETLWKYTHAGKNHPTKKEGEIIEPSKTDLFALKRMARDSGYRLRKITLQEAKKKKFLGIDILWPDQKEKTQWVLEDAQGNIVEPAGEEKSPYPDYPDAFLEDGVWKVERDGKKYRIEE